MLEADKASEKVEIHVPGTIREDQHSYHRNDHSPF